MDIRSTINQKKLKQWQIAEVIGVSEFTLSRWLRRPENLSQKQKLLIESAIKRLVDKEA